MAKFEATFDPAQPKTNLSTRNRGWLGRKGMHEPRRLRASAVGRGVNVTIFTY